MGGADQPRLYLVAPPDSDPAALAARLPALIERHDIACLLLDWPEATDSAFTAAVTALKPITDDAGIALLLAGAHRTKLVQKLGCDGLHLTDPKDYADARKALGPNRIVGVHCGTSRHDAMDVGEADADYVAFAPDRDTIAIWALAMTVPCIAWCVGLPASSPDLAALQAANPEFIARTPDDLTRTDLAG